LGHDDEIAHYNQGWRFIVPVNGMSLWVLDEDKLYVWNGTIWQLSTSSTVNLDDLGDAVITTPATDELLRFDGANFINSNNINQLGQVGVNTFADSSNKFSVKSDSVLFSADTNDSRIKVNKTAATDTASHLFQTNFSGRAEFGLIGNDDFGVKVSPDGSTFYESIVIDKDSGDIEFKAIVGYGEPSELTIATGAVTINKSNHIIDTESNVATDDLDTVNGGVNGQIIYLSAADTTRTVVLKDGTGNLKLAGDFSLDSSDDIIVLQKRNGNWLEISRSNNAV